MELQKERGQVSEQVNYHTKRHGMDGWDVSQKQRDFMSRKVVCKPQNPCTAQSIRLKGVPALMDTLL